MRPVRFVLRPLLELFQRLRAATMPEMKAALGTRAEVTVFRKLASLPYQTSYSHRGAFYTLASIPRFDSQGLWCCRGAWFSPHGTLLNTAELLVSQAPAGYFTSELEEVLHVPAKDALRQLVQAARLHRQDFHGLYLYTAKDPSRRQEQRAARQAQWEAGDAQEQQLRAADELVYTLLNEQQRRLYAGLESFKEGHGGDPPPAPVLWRDGGTGGRGRRGLPARQLHTHPVRAPSLRPPP